MGNTTDDEWTDYEWTDYEQLMEVTWAIWKVLPPFILLPGIIGNLVTILVMRRIRDNNSSQYVILMALAMSDTCLLCSGLTVRWSLFAYDFHAPDLHTVLCKLHRYVRIASNTTSAWLVTTATVQRTMAVMWPHLMKVMCTVRRTWVIVAVVIITAWSVHLHLMIGFHVRNNYCTTTGKYKRFYKDFWRNWMDMFISSLIPSFCLIVCSVQLSLTLFHSTSHSSAAVHATSNVNTGGSNDDRKSAATKTTVMILALSCTFLFLTLPNYIYRHWYLNAEINTPKAEALDWLFYTLARLMWYTNSAVNFLLYCLTGTRFRTEFMSFLLCGAKVRTVRQ